MTVFDVLCSQNLLLLPFYSSNAASNTLDPKKCALLVVFTGPKGTVRKTVSHHHHANLCTGGGGEGAQTAGRINAVL